MTLAFSISNQNELLRIFSAIFTSSVLPIVYHLYFYCNVTKKNAFSNSEFIWENISNAFDTGGQCYVNVLLSVS